MRRSALWMVLVGGLSFVGAPQGTLAQSTAEWVPPAARDAGFQLSIWSIMRAEENLGEPPAQVRWTDDSEWVYFSWRPGGLTWSAERSLYRVPASGGEPERVTGEDEDRAEILTAGGDISEDGRWRVSSVRGDLYLVERPTMDVRRLTHTEDAEGQPLFTEDGEGILFRRGDDLYRIGMDGSLTQLTRISTTAAESNEEEAEGQRGFLEDQQRELFEHIRLDLEREARRDSIREAHAPITTHLDRGERVQGLTPNRQGTHVLLRAGRSASDSKGTVIPNWITEDGYTRDINGRSKVGDQQGSSRVGILETATGEVAWLDVEPDGYEADEPSSVFTASWNDAGTKAVVFAVSFDDEDRWIWSFDATTGERTLLDHLHDDAWVAGPCFTCTGFIPGTDRVYFVSEASGYAQLYAIDADGSNRQRLTSGDWEVLGLTISEDESGFLLEHNRGSPFDEHVARVGFDGSGWTDVTSGEGRFVAELSPDGERVALVHDVANRPPELFLADADDTADREQITDSPLPSWKSFDWIRPEIVHVRASDGTMVPARIYRPSDLGADPNGAGILFVHGAGYLHNVHNYWSSYYREYQFNHLLAAAGYTVLDIDYRGSAGYGAEWRTGIYRWMGGKDLSDQVDGARWLVANEGVDADRIGLYGGSYGGFITLMALFTAGDTFKSGAALRSVTDWAHYNHGYTSRILNQPQDDEEAYRQSSPIYFAESFRPDQHLLMLHGMVDTNVHFSDVVRLSQRLIELGKENWELAVYPVENHGFTEPTSWTDEYRRIFELFERTLREPGCTDGGGLCDLRRAGG